MSPRALRWVVGALCLVAGSGCVRAATQVIAVVDSDLATPPACVFVEVRELEETEPSTSLFFVRDAGAPRVTFPYSFGVARPGRRADARIEIRARALAACTEEPSEAQVLVSRTVRTGFVEEQAVAVRLFLSSACTGVVCDPEQTCDDGRCVAIPELAPTRADVITPGTELGDAGGAADDASAHDDAGCAESPCRLPPPQCGCGASEGCYANASGTSAACAPAGSTPLGGRCATESDCVPGATCLTAPSPLTGNTCTALCTVGSTCDDGSACLILRAPGFPTLGTCQSACDPLTSAGCPDGRTCFLVSYSGPPWLLQCVDAPGTVPEGGGCTGAADCVPEHVCTNGACRHLCTLADGGGCDAGRSCTAPTTGAIRVGTREYGVCVP